MDDAASPPARQPQNQNFRSAASNNWRVKDDAPRVEHQPPRARYNRSQNDPRQHSQSQSHSSISAQQANDEAAGTRLYVGNLLYTAQRTDIEELFTSHGFNVVGVSISTDPFTGRNPSYCFVDVDSADEAQRAIAELNGTDVLGRAVRVSPGVAKRGPSGANGGNANASASPGAAGGAGGGREVRVKNFERGWGRETREERNTDYKPTFDRWNRTDAPSHWTAPQSEGRRLYIGNLPRIEPQSALDEEIQALFNAHLSDLEIMPTAVSKQISPRPARPSEPGNHYYCFVDLERAEDVDAVIERLDGKEGSWGGALRVNRARGSDRKVVREQNLGSGQGPERERRSEGGWRKGDGHE